MNKKLKLDDLLGMSHEQLIKDEEHLPDCIDISTLTSENFEDFRNWLIFASDDSIAYDKNYKNLRIETGKFSVTSLLSMVGGGSAHEGLHAITAKATGGEVYKITLTAKELSTELFCPTQESYLATLLAPNIVLPILGFYLMHKGWNEKNGICTGVGFTTMMMGINPDPFGDGDLYRVVSLLSELDGKAATIATLGLITGLYLSTFMLGKKIYQYEGKIKDKFSKSKSSKL